MNYLIRLLINFAATAIVILLFRHLGWLQFVSPPHILDDQTLNDLITAGILGFLMFAIKELANLAFSLLKIATCGLGCLLEPIFGFILGYIILIGTQMLLPDWFTFDNIWWKVMIISVAIGLFRIPKIQQKKKK